MYDSQILQRFKKLLQLVQQFAGYIACAKKPEKVDRSKGNCLFINCY